MNSLQLQDIFRSLDCYVEYKTGQAIFKEGEFGDVMYVLMEGLVDVQVQGKTVGTFEPIEIFGEMAVIDAGPRSATVIARTDCKFIPVNQKRFVFLVQQKPQFAIHIMRMLVERIRWMDAQASDASAAAQEESTVAADSEAPRPEEGAPAAGEPTQPAPAK